MISLPSIPLPSIRGLRGLKTDKGFLTFRKKKLPIKSAIFVEKNETKIWKVF